MGRTSLTLLLVLGLLVTLWMTRGSAEPRLLAAALVLPALGLRHLLDPPSATGGGVLELLADGRGESLMASFAANLLAAFAVGALGYSLRERNRAERLQWDSMESLRALIGFFGSARASSDDRISELLALGCRVLGLEVGMLLRDRGGRFEVLATSAPADFPLAVGSEVMLPEAVHEGIASGAVAMEDRAFSPSPGSEAASLRSSLSHRVEAAGEPSCVLCFASPTARHRRFGDVDKQLLSLTAHCVAEELRQLITERGAVLQAPLELRDACRGQQRDAAHRHQHRPGPGQEGAGGGGADVDLLGTAGADPDGGVGGERGAR